MPDVAQAVLVQSTIGAGTIIGFDTDNAHAMPGVLAIITPDNAPKLPMKDGPQQMVKTPLLQDNAVHFNGQHVPMVVAQTLDQADAAAARVRVRYRRDEPVTSMESVLDQAYPAKKFRNGERPPDSRRGDPDAAFDNAAAPHACTRSRQRQLRAGVCDRRTGDCAEFGPIGVSSAQLRRSGPAHQPALRQQGTARMQGAEAFGWSRRSSEPRSMRDGNVMIGWGMATSTYPTHRMPASARVRVSANGAALVQVGTQDLGTGTYTVMSQAAADALGIPVERIQFELGDSAFPHAPVSSGSMTVASVGPAVKAACEAVRGETGQ